MTLRLFALLLIWPFVSSDSNAQPTPQAIDRVLIKINTLRAEGCSCGHRQMAPTHPLQWNKSLYQVANKYARYMVSNDIFAHVDKDGHTVAERVSATGYAWHEVGENIAMGYDDFYEVLQAWIDSPSHCEMLMHPSMRDFGMSKHKDYWVQVFALPSTSYRYMTH